VRTSRVAPGSAPLRSPEAGLTALSNRRCFSASSRHDRGGDRESAPDGRCRLAGVAGGGTIREGDRHDTRLRKLLSVKRTNLVLFADTAIAPEIRRSQPR
jgi:hypothetical protein